MTSRSSFASIAVVLALLISVASAFYQPGRAQSAPLAVIGTAFTYQGQLKDNGVPANGAYDLQFALYNAASGGTQIGGTISVNDLTVTNGLFTTQLDFGANAFTGDARYLEIRVRPGASTGAYTTLAPRQAITPAPYALALPGLYTQQNATSPNLIGGYGGNSVTSGVVGAAIGGGGVDVNINRVTDHYGTVGGGSGNRAGDNAGTTGDRQYATVGGGFQNTASGSYAVVGGGWLNTASGAYATVGGGVSHSASGTSAAIGGGYQNTVSGNYATASGGIYNRASSDYAAVSGGQSNTASGTYATVGGGYANTASITYTVVSGGTNNTASGNSATVGGGWNNTASGNNATVGGGRDNTVSEESSTVSGGTSNRVYDRYGTISGGRDNSVYGYAATVGGGRGNLAVGDYSFVVGRRAINSSPSHDGVFMFADSTDADFISTGANKFLVRATGGIEMYTNAGTTTGVRVAAGGGSWSSISDRAVKESFEAVDSREILARLVALPIQTWSYKAQDPSIRHIGPIAQDFYAAFGMGEDEKYIATIDADGVALAAIQGLYQIVQEKDAEISDLKSQISDLEARLSALEQRESKGMVNAWGPHGWDAALMLLFGAIGMVVYQRIRRGGA